MPDYPDLPAALAWLKADRRRGYKSAAKRFGIPHEAIAQAARAADPARQRSRTRARDELDAHPDTPPPGMDLLAWYQAELTKLDEAWRMAEPREKAQLTTRRQTVVERIAALENQQGAKNELERPDRLLEAVVVELEKSHQLLSEDQARRVISLAETTRRVHNLD